MILFIFLNLVLQKLQLKISSPILIRVNFREQIGQYFHFGIISHFGDLQFGHWQGLPGMRAGQSKSHLSQWCFGISIMVSLFIRLTSTSPIKAMPYPGEVEIIFMSTFSASNYFRFWILMFRIESGAWASIPETFPTEIMLIQIMPADTNRLFDQYATLKSNGPPSNRKCIIRWHPSQIYITAGGGS